MDEIIMFNANYDIFSKICKQAVEDENIFKNFKREQNFTMMLEHVTMELGLQYLLEIEKNDSSILNNILKFATNDNIGNPNIFFYPKINISISPTTLRYIKTLTDLMKIFGNLDGMNIVEIGSAYGGQCKIIHDIIKPSSYTLIDLPEVLDLSKKYLSHFEIENLLFNNINQLENKTYDLCISNYAFTEVNREYQNMFIEKIIQNSNRGYITCNYVNYWKRPEALTKEDILALKSNYIVYPEIPETYEARGVEPDPTPHFIYTWKI